MIYPFIAVQKNRWLAQADCPARDVLAYMRQQGNLRAAQLEAIETYLFLKLAGQNRPLWQLIAEGLFAQPDDLAQLHISQVLRDELQTDIALKGLFDLARTPLPSGKLLFPDLVQAIKDNPQGMDATRTLQGLFYGITYTDYLFSLPMGAGKTWLMAAFMYLDLYFARNEPDNPVFAHNFLVMIPSGLKSSLAPSLKTILHFDPAWLLPEPAAGELRRLLRFEILDQPKAAQKNNQARSPNAHKVASYQPFDSLMGLVLIVNAEKVILDRLDVDAQLHLIERSDDDKDKAANELRNIIGKIPNLQIHIDEVHHAATDDIKLRQVVGKWSANGTVNSVLGFSGTPYLSKPEQLALTPTLKLKSTQISNTVFYYPLVTAIQQFLKKPRVEQTQGLNPLQIVERGVKDFLQHWGTQRYRNGTGAKLAIYCGSIERLEEQVYPQLISMGIPATEILKYHKGNARYKLPKENDTEFLSLDTPVSGKKIILLVQVGKEGWDCRSLAGVILSQKGDCPTNMVLQTACRCLRQMDGGQETALIWLNDDNAKILDRQLQEEQHTSIAEINRLTDATQPKMVERVSRTLHLCLPPVDFFQMRIVTSTVVADGVEPADKLQAIDAATFVTTEAQITSRTLDAYGQQTTRFEYAAAATVSTFRQWLLEIVKSSYGALSLAQLKVYESTLQVLFEKTAASPHYDHAAIQAQVRLAFHSRHTLQMLEEIIPHSAELLQVCKLTPIAAHDQLYPNASDCQKIIELDKSGGAVSANEDELRKLYAAQVETLTAMGMAHFIQPFEAVAQQYAYSAAVQAKEQTFHYLPYDFSQSAFEQTFLESVLRLDSVQQRKLEVYYNGERALTEFRIDCFQPVASKGWRKVGSYTPDFLLIQREADTLHKILIVETKGKGYAEQPAFQQRKAFVEQQFVPFNNAKFGYDRFDYLYIQDDDKQFLASVARKINAFFSA